MSVDPAALARWAGAKENQYLERKTAWERPQGGSARKRDPKAVTRDIVETLAALANAEGGELIVGIEDDGTITGVPHSENAVGMMLRAAGQANYVQPPLHFTAEQVTTADGHRLLRFATEWSPVVHQLADGRYVLRADDRNMPSVAALDDDMRLIVEIVGERGSVQNQDVQDLLGINRQLARRLLERLVDLEWLERAGGGRATAYVPGARALEASGLR